MDINARGTDNKKRFGWTKIVDMMLRSVHIGTSSILFGGVVWAVPFVRMSGWHSMVIATGSSLIVFNIFRCRHWPYQGRGLMAALHVGLICAAHIRPELMVSLLITALAVGVTGSHMPAFIRHWSLVHRRRLD